MRQEPGRAGEHEQPPVNRSRTVLLAAAAVWSALSIGIALAALADVNPDARLLAAALVLVGGGCSVGAVVIGIRRRRPGRTVGLLLIGSLVTPIYYAYPLAVIAVVVAVWILMEPEALSVSVPATPPSAP
jgi:hypothetical protein